MSKEKVKCKHYCSIDNSCIWSQGKCDIYGNLCVYEYNKFWRSNLNNNIQLTLF